MLILPQFRSTGKSMPRKYPDQTKREGHTPNPRRYFFHRYTTAVPTLHQWPDQLRKKQNGSYVRKNFSIGHKTDTKSASRCKQRRNLPTRRRPPNGWGYPPPPRVYILYLYTMPKHGYFMGILWAFYGHFIGILRAFARTFAPRPTISVDDQCRRSVSKGCVYAPYATHATNRQPA